MKTQGVVVVEGYLVSVYPAYGRGVPDPLWSRLKHAITKAGLMDEYLADYARERPLVLAAMPTFPSDRLVHMAQAEERLFRRWVERLGLSWPLWPWQRGWTEALVDAYLVTPPKSEAA